MSDLISISKAAELLGVHIDTLREWDKKKIINSVRPSKSSHRRYLRSDIDKFLRVELPPKIVTIDKDYDQSSYLEKLEAEFIVNYPINNAATYNSLVNYKQDLNTPFQRWCNYKEGYSLELNELIFNYYGVNRGESQSIILDPFSGSGSTLLAAKQYGLSSIGFEVNQFSHFFSKVKTRNYTDSDLKLLNSKLNQYSKDDFWKTDILEVKLPSLSIADKMFDKAVVKDIYRLKQDIEIIKNDKVRDLLKFIWLSNLEYLSNYRKAGNGLKARKTKRERELPSVKDEIISKLKMVLDDIRSVRINGIEPIIYGTSCTSLSEHVANNSIRGVIFSPPYANCFDYTEIYKVELWFGEFVSNTDDLRKLRAETLRSHLNRKYDSQIHTEAPLLPILEKLDNENLWSKRIPLMIRGYFADMRSVISQLYSALEKGGFCAIVVSNSAYSGMVIPTDLIIATIAKSIGFRINKIDIARNIITSSQQYEKTIHLRKYLRESVIYMEKK